MNEELRGRVASILYRLTLEMELDEGELLSLPEDIRHAIHQKDEALLLRLLGYSMPYMILVKEPDPEDDEDDGKKAMASADVWLIPGRGLMRARQAVA